MKAVIYIALFVICGSAQATSCDRFTLAAYDLQMDRQHRRQIDYVGSNAMERDMRSQVYQIPLWFSDKRKAAAASRFARDWGEACRMGVYK